MLKFFERLNLETKASKEALATTIAEHRLFKDLRKARLVTNSIPNRSIAQVAPFRRHTNQVKGESVMLLSPEEAVPQGLFLPMLRRSPTVRCKPGRRPSFGMRPA